MFSTDNMKKAGLCTVAILLALNLTATQSKLIQGGAAFVACVGGLYAATKI